MTVSSSFEGNTLSH